MDGQGTHLRPIGVRIRHTFGRKFSDKSGPDVQEYSWKAGRITSGVTP